MTITNGLPRINGQAEILNSTVISVISKWSKDDLWFEFMFGTEINQKEYLKIINILNSAFEEQFVKDREDICKESNQNILIVQQINRKQYNLCR